MAFDRIAVVGAGAWGCALANVIARAGRPVLLATRDRAGADHIVSRRESPRLPGLKLDERIGIAPLSAAVGRYDAILLAVPSQHLRAAASAIAPELAPGTPVIACAKGIEHGTHRFMTEVIAESCRRCAAGDPVGPELRRRRGARAAGGGDARGARRDDRGGARARARVGHAAALSFERRARGRDRRRRQERARDRRRHRRRARARRQRRRRGGHARLCRAVPLRPRVRRARGDVDRPVRARRPDPELLERAVAQLFLRRRARQRRSARRPAASWRKASSPRRSCSRWRTRRASRCRSPPPWSPSSPAAAASTRRSKH